LGRVISAGEETALSSCPKGPGLYSDFQVPGLSKAKPNQCRVVPIFCKLFGEPLFIFGAIRAAPLLFWGGHFRRGRRVRAEGPGMGP